MTLIRAEKYSPRMPDVPVTEGEEEEAEEAERERERGRGRGRGRGERERERERWYRVRHVSSSHACMHVTHA
jgi:hypothetical protein